MPANTTCLDFPYPLDSDRIDVALHIKQLAQKLDTYLCGLELGDLDNRFVNKTGDTMTGMLYLPSTNPTSVNHAVRKKWVDDNFVHVSGDTMTGVLILDQVNSTSPNAATRREWQLDTFVNVTGDTMTGILTLDGADATGANAAMRREWILDRVGERLAKTGGTIDGPLTVTGNTSLQGTLHLAGPLNMEGKQINNVADPSQNQDVATKKWVTDHFQAKP